MPNTQVWGQVGETDQVSDQDLVSLGNEIIEVADIDDAARSALKATNKNNGASARALYTEGQVELVAGLTGDPAITAVKVYNPSTHDDARALAVTGTGDITVQLANTVDEADKQALNVMGNTHLQSYTGENAAHKTLEVVNNSTHADARGLKVEGKSEIEDMIIDSTNLNANGYLKLGTQSPTTSVKVGNLNNELSLAGDPIYMEGHVLAGESIDANGDGPTDLAIGTDASTQDLKLSQDGQIVDIMGDARLNENEFVVNDAANLAAGTGCGFKYNSGGHPGPNMPCIDFYVGGNVVGWIDADGWTNAP